MCIGSVPVKWEVKFLGVTTVCYAGLPVTDTETNIQVEVGDNILVTKKTTKTSIAKITFDLHFYLHIFWETPQTHKYKAQKVDELFWI